MTLFWISVAGLSVLAMAFFIIPFLRKTDYASLSSDELNLSVFNQQLEELDSDLSAGKLDQAQYNAARVDLEKELLVDVSGDHAQSAAASSHSGKWILSLAVVVPLLALLFYQTLGTPEIINKLAANPTAGQRQATAHAQSQSTQGLPPMEELVKKLAAKMQQQPENLEGWIMLGRSYMSLGQSNEAIAAYERAMSLNGENTGLLLAYAEALAKQTGNKFSGKAESLIKKAYSVDSQNTNSLWMMGIVSFQQERFQDAINHWEQLADLLGPQSKELASVDNAINDARAKLGLGPQFPSIVQTSRPAQQSAPKSESPTSEAVDASAIQVTIKLSPELAAKVKPSDTVFIYAKATPGPPMPLAAARKQVKDLPLTLVLDDRMAMMPQMKLSSFPKVAVGARISLSGGGPSAQPGDLEGEIRPVTPGQSEPVTVIIDSIHQ